MTDLTREADQLAMQGILMLLLVDYLGRQPDPSDAAQVMFDVLPRVIAESHGGGLPEPLINAAGAAVRQFIEDAHAVQALWRVGPGKPAEHH